MEPAEQYNTVEVDVVDVRDLVLSYLVHHCYKDTLECLTSDASSFSKLSLQNTFIDERKSLYTILNTIFV